MAFNLEAYSQTVRVTDGAWGTQMHLRGLPVGASPELWNLNNPSAVGMVADNYVRTGCDILLTNTFGANRFVLASHGAAHRVGDVAEAGVKISRIAATGPLAKGRDVKVFASIGPTGKIVMTEEVSTDALSAAFAEAAESLAWGGADAIVLETFNELAEAEIALKAVRKATDIPVVVCLTFGSGSDKAHSLMGDTPEKLVRMAEANGASAVGANCGVGPENCVAIAKMLRAATALPIWMKPNAGVPSVGKDGKVAFPMSPAQFASFVPALVSAGANFIGGCCGTTPAHIEAVRSAVDKLQAGRRNG